MAAALIVPISGPYLGTFDAKTLGTQNDDGFELSVTYQGQEINASDAYGLTLMEGIYRGENWKLRLRGLEWNKSGLLDAMQMLGQGGASGTFTPILANIGQRLSAFSKTLLLTAILANPPTTPQTLTALSCVLSPQSQSAFNFTSKMRETPLEFVLLPYTGTVASTSVVTAFTTTP